MLSRIFAAALLSSTAAMSAQAAVVVYTDRASFEAAAGSFQTETFEDFDLGAFDNAGGLFAEDFDGFSVSGETNGNFVGIANGPESSSGPNLPIPASFAGQKFFSWANQTGGVVSITIQLNEQTTAFGFDWFNTDRTDQYNFSVTASGNYSAPPFTVVNGSPATSGFFGLISDTAFSTATITNDFNGGYISDEGFDNLTTNGVGSVNPPSDVPAPAALGLLGLGIGAMALRRRRAAR